MRSPNLRRFLFLFFVFSLAVTVLMRFPTRQVYAGNTITVNSTADVANPTDGLCTLREAITAANNNFASGSVAGECSAGASDGTSDTIVFSTGGIINLTGALPTISSNMSLVGPGSGSLSVRRDTGGDYRIFTINSLSAAISGMTITNGRTPDSVLNQITPGGPSGGGIFQSGGALTLTDVVVTGNTTGKGYDDLSSGSSSGGTGGPGGGIDVIGTLTMFNCVVSNNTTGNGGQGGTGGSGGFGAGMFIESRAQVTLQNVLITGNVTGTGGGPTSGQSGYGGGIWSGGSGFQVTTSLNMTNVTISNNATANANGTTGGGAGLYVIGGTATLTNCTVANNHTGNSSHMFRGAGAGGGIFNDGVMKIVGSTISGNTTGSGDPAGDGNPGGGIDNLFILTMINSTVSGNSTGTGSSAGGGISGGSILNLINCTITGNVDSSNRGHGVATSNQVNLRNTIIARNGPGGSGPDIDGVFVTPTVTSQGHNLIGNPGTITSFTAPGDQVGVDPMLSPLANNGGPTLTHALLSNSPALDAGDNCVADAAHCGDANITQLLFDQRGLNRKIDGPDPDVTVTVDIGAFEKQPSLQDLGEATILEDTTASIGFDVDDPGSITSATVTSSNPLVPNTAANLSINLFGSTEIVTATPGANLNGVTDLTITINRASGSTSNTITLRVTPVNDAPSFTRGLDQTVAENAGPQLVSNWATNISPGPPDEIGQALSFQVVSNTNQGLFSAAPAVDVAGNLTYTPANGASGSATIGLALKDGDGTANGGVDTSPVQTFVITVQDGGTLQFTNTVYSTSEPNNATITVQRFGGTAGETRVNYATSDGTAIAGQDYTAASGTLVFAPGVTSQTFTVPITNDSLDEDDEVVNLTLSNTTGSGALGSVSTAQLRIIDDDPPSNLRINDVALLEGQSGSSNAVFTVSLTPASGRTVTANFSTADGTATASSSDYQATSGSVVFNPGETSKTISVSVFGDTSPESDETFFVNINSAINGALADSQGMCTILTDDGPGGVISFSSGFYSVAEGGSPAVITVNRTGNNSLPVTVDYTTSDGNASLVPCTTPSGSASSRCDFETAIGTLRFAAGETSKTIPILINQDNIVEGPETLGITLTNATGGAGLGATSVSATLTINDDVTESPSNPIDDFEGFVRQHYRDFLNREPDQDGLNFWVSQFTQCNGDPQCLELRRINVSAAFFLSIEFQQTGYLVERTYRTAFGFGSGQSTFGGSHTISVPIVRLNELFADGQEISQGVIVNQPGWEQILESNKQAYFNRFVQRSRFTNAVPTFFTPSQYVDRLNQNAGFVLSASERTQLINDLTTNNKTRAQVLRAVAEHPTLAAAESNRAFVLMQFFGYLRRNPNDPQDTDYTGYDFWLTKLNQFGNFQDAEMVKAFISSDEYRHRFGP